MSFMQHLKEKHILKFFFHITGLHRMNITFEVKNKYDETTGYSTIVTTIYYTG